MKKGKLNGKEIAILEFTAEGYTDAEISELLCISVSYVRRLLEGLYDKSGAINKANLVAWAYKNSILKENKQ